MDHIRILRRALDITRLYRALWVFGILLALTAAKGSSNSGSSSSYRLNQGNNPFNGHNFPPFSFPSLPSNIVSTLMAVGIGLICFILLLVVIFAIVRYVSQTALIRMTNGYEATGEKVSVGTGFRLGWSRGAFRIWLIDLMIGLATLLVVIVLLLVAAAPLLLWLTRNNVAGGIGTVITIGLVFLVILVIVVVAAIIALIVQVTRRAVILEGLGVFEGIRRGWGLIRRHAGDVIIMGLIMFGLGLIFAIVMIPVFFLLLLVAGVLGGLPGLLVGGLAHLITGSNIAIVLGLIVGLPIFLVVLLVPLLFIGGLYEVFSSNVWTLTYRELLALESVAAETPAPPAPEPPALDAEV